MAQVDLEDVKKAIKNIRKQYVCEHKDGMSYDDFLSAKEGFEELMTRLNKIVKKAAK